MRRRTASLALLIAPLSAPVMAEPFWPDHARFALKPRVSLSVRPATIMVAQRQARIYAIELAPSPASPADLRLSVQRRRQRFASLRAVRQALLPGADVSPRTSIMLADMQVDLPNEVLPLGDRLTATIGWQAVKINNRSANVTSLFSRDDLRARDAFMPSLAASLIATDRLTISADYGEAMQAYGDSGTMGSLGMDMAGFRAFRNALRPQRNSRTLIGARWQAAPGLHVGLEGFAGRIGDRLGFGTDEILPRNMGSATVRGFGIEAGQHVTPTLHMVLRYDRARLDMVGAGVGRVEQRIALHGQWRRGPWRSALSVARASMPAWAQPGHRLRMEGGVDYWPADRPGLRIGLHLTDPDQLAGAHIARLHSGPVRAIDQSRALMLAAALRW